jgi:hypothetical protein
MSQVYGDHDSIPAGGYGRFASEGIRRLIGAVLFLGLVALMGLWAYRLGTRDAAEVPIIRAMEGPARIEPADPGGLRPAHQGLEVNAVLAGQPAPAPGAAAPLEPPPSPLAEEDGPQGELVLASPAPSADAELTPDADLRMPVPDDGPVGLAESAPPAPPEAAPAPVVDQMTIAALVEAAVEPQSEPEAETDVGTRPLRRPSNLARAASQAPQAPAAREIASVGEGARLIQLGAFDSEAMTRDAWSRLVAEHGDLLGGKSLYVERTTSNARVFYRLRVSSFESADESRAMCEALRVRGVDCIPVTLP